jgi:hypothetical protein
MLPRRASSCPQIICPPGCPRRGGAIRTLFSSSCCNCDERDHHGGLDLSAAPAGTRAEAVRMEDTDDALVCGNWYVTIGRWDAGAE